MTRKLDSEISKQSRWARKRKEAFARGELSDVQHGTAHTYRTCGCRCEECVEAGRNEQRRRLSDSETYAAVLERHKRERSIGRESAVRLNYQWTSVEIEIATERARSGQYLRTAAEVALMIHRTVNAVQQMRSRCRYDPRYAAQAARVIDE